MSAEALFTITTLAVVPGWLLLILLPRWCWGSRLICTVLLPGLLGLLYLWLILSNWRSSLEGGYGTLAEVGSLFANPWLLLAGWVHYLAFDLFIGAWQVRDARQLRIHHLLVVPCLILTFLLGPVGLLAYLGVRGSLRHRLLLGEGSAHA